MMRPRRIRANRPGLSASKKAMAIAGAAANYFYPANKKRKSNRNQGFSKLGLKRSRPDPYAIMKNPHAGIQKGGKNKIKKGKPKDLKSRVKLLEKKSDHPIVTFRDVRTIARVVCSAGQCAYQETVHALWSSAAGSPQTDLLAAIKAFPPKGIDPQTGLVYDIDFTANGGNGFKKIHFHRIKATHVFKNNYQVGVNATFYWFVAKTNVSNNVNTCFANEMTAAGLAGTTDLNLTPTQFYEWRKMWHLEKSEKKFLAPGEIFQCSVESPAVTIDTQRNTFTQNVPYVKGVTRSLYVRIHGDIVHDNADHTLVTTGACSLDHICYTTIKWQPLGDLINDTVKTNKNLNTVASNLLIDPDAPQSVLNPAAP